MQTISPNSTDDLTRTLSRLPRAPRFLVLTGAGCSTASGIPDYRDHDGQWKRPQPVHLPDFLGSEHARKRYWARSMAGWRSFDRAQPNTVHATLARMEAGGYCTLLVTQNVDGLHQRGGSQQVIDLHGRLDTVICLACDHRTARGRLQHRLNDLNPQWSHVAGRIAPDGDVDLEQVDYDRFHIPDCERCGGTLKPDVVFFGENVPRPRVERAMAALEDADALLIVGSSLMVYSGFRFARAAQKSGKPVIILNRGKTRADDIADAKLDTDLVHGLGAFLQHVAEA